MIQQVNNWMFLFMIPAKPYMIALELAMAPQSYYIGSLIVIMMVVTVVLILATVLMI